MLVLVIVIHFMNNWKSLRKVFISCICTFFVCLLVVTFVVLSDKMCQIWCTACTFCHSSTFGDKTCWKVHSLHVLSPLCQQHYNLSFPSLVCVCVSVRACACMCLCVRARTCACEHTCVCVCVDVHLSKELRASTCVLLCIVFIIPASVSAKLKFCIALCIYRLRGYSCL